MIIKNAIIESGKIDIDRGFALSAWLFLDYGGMHQGFGGYLLHHTDRDFKQTYNYAGHFITRCMQIAGVENWENIAGKTIRVQCDKEGLGGKIIAIGHIVKDDWFSPCEEFKEHEQDKQEGEG